MGKKRYNKTVNGFLMHEKKRNGQIEGVQSLRNRRTYTFAYDEKKGDFVGRWIDTPSFVRNAVKAVEP